MREGKSTEEGAEEPLETGLLSVNVHEMRKKGRRMAAKASRLLFQGTASDTDAADIDPGSFPVEMILAKSPVAVSVPDTRDGIRHDIAYLMAGIVVGTANADGAVREDHHIFPQRDTRISRNLGLEEDVLVIEVVIDGSHLNLDSFPAPSRYESIELGVVEFLMSEGDGYSEGPIRFAPEESLKESPHSLFSVEPSGFRGGGFRDAEEVSSPNLAVGFRLHRIQTDLKTGQTGFIEVRDGCFLGNEGSVGNESDGFYSGVPREADAIENPRMH